MIPDSPTIEHLTGIYLNLDWPDAYGSVWNAVDAFVAREQPEYTSDLLEEVEGVLASDPSEDELRTFFLTDLHSGYLPSGEGYTYRQWLVALLDRLHGAK
jgi:hypothetical protein